MSNLNPTSKKRLHWVDQTKGLAILGIVLFHFFQNYPDRLGLVQILDRNGARLGYAAVDIFFVIAGFNTSYTLASLLHSGKIRSFLEMNWWQWLKKRLIRLYPTYWLAIGLSLLLYYLFSKIGIKSILDFALIVIGWPGYQRFKTINPGFWFFSVILQAYLVTPLIFSISQSKRLLILILGIVVGLTSKIACLLFIQDSSIFWFLLQNNFLGSYFFQLCLGLYWGLTYFEHQSFRKVDIVTSISVFIVGLAIYSFFIIQKINILYMIGFDILFSPLFLLICYWIFEFLSHYKLPIYTLGIFSIMGVYSYQIYLIHQPLYFVLLPYLVNQIDFNPYLRLLLSIMTTTSLLTLYVIAFIKLESCLGKLMEKMPKHSV